MVKRFKKFLTLSVAAVLSLTVAVIAGCKNGDNESGDEKAEPPLWASTYTLPDAQSAMDKVLEIYGSAEKTYLLQSSIVRMPCPENGAGMTINVKCELGEYAKLVLEDSVEEFNDVFKVINPNYKFAVNYAPTDADLASENSIRLTSATLQSSETKMTLGQAPHGYNGSWICNFGIVLDTKTLVNGSYLMMTFKHELMHLLGAGDAYKNPEAHTSTVMQSYTVNGYHSLSKTDVAFLDALYRNPNAPYTDAQINAFIEGYEENNLHTKANNISAVYTALINNVGGETLSAQLSSFGYADIKQLCSLTAKGIDIDNDFGKTSISFTELEYTVRPERTYFGSFNTETVKYTHGMQKENLGSSFTIGYTDYGNGLLYSAPNGNNYTLFVKTGGYVLLFRLEGGFNSLGGIGVTLWHACTVN